MVSGFSGDWDLLFGRSEHFFEDRRGFLEELDRFFGRSDMFFEDWTCVLVRMLSEQRCVYEKCIVLLESLDFRRYVRRYSG